MTNKGGSIVIHIMFKLSMLIDMQSKIKERTPTLC